MAPKWDPRITEKKKSTYKVLLFGHGSLGLLFLVLALLPHRPGAGSRAVFYLGGAVFLALALFAAYALSLLRRRRREDLSGVGGPA